MAGCCIYSTLALYVIFPTSGHGSGQAKPKPGPSQGTWLGLEILEAKATQSQAKATGFQAKPSQNITIYGYSHILNYLPFMICVHILEGMTVYFDTPSDLVD